MIGEFGGRAMVVPGHVISETRVFGHPGGTVLASPWELTTHYVQLLRHVFEEKENGGSERRHLHAAHRHRRRVQRLLTYDRAVVKVDLDQVAAANQGRLPPPKQFRVLSPYGGKATGDVAVHDRATGSRLVQAGFDASAWKEGPAPLGASPRKAPAWTTPNVWIRREFEIGNEKLVTAAVDRTPRYGRGSVHQRHFGGEVDRLHHRIPGVRDPAGGPASLKPGKNLLAVHAFHDGNQQLIDVGVVDPLPQ